VTPPSSPKRLIVFVRAPNPGTVKTRLAAEIGPTAALAAYLELVESLLSRLQGLPGVELHFTPAEERRGVEGWLREGWKASPQSPGDLGARMNSAFQTAFSEGATHVVLIGSDCPEVSGDDVILAWRSLGSHDVVLGPAADGGYWLIGLGRPQPALFQSIPWSTPRVFGTTLANAIHAGLRVRLLRDLADIDTAQDWHAYRARRLSNLAKIGAQPDSQGFGRR
jgi:rSAM/selenodomain-associated transferase 1